MAIDVSLRSVRDEDLVIFFAQQKDPDAIQMAAFTQRDPLDQAAFMTHWANIRSDDSVTIRTILFDKRVAGYVAQFEQLSVPEVCYFLGREYWGQGIATAALSQLLQEVAIRPLYAAVAHDNIGSIRVLEKCGFVAFRRQTAFAEARGQEIDELIMTLA